MGPRLRDGSTEQCGYLRCVRITQTDNHGVTRPTLWAALCEQSGCGPAFSRSGRRERRPSMRAARERAELDHCLGCGRRVHARALAAARRIDARFRPARRNLAARARQRLGLEFFPSRPWRTLEQLRSNLASLPSHALVRATRRPRTALGTITRLPSPAQRRARTDARLRRHKRRRRRAPSLAGNTRKLSPLLSSQWGTLPSARCRTGGRK